jgi:molecular chaperone GrpE
MESTSREDQGPIQEESLESVQQERDEYQRNWQRALADYQNLRRRLASDVDDAVKRGKQSLITDLLLVLDSLDLALSAPATTPEAQSLRKGVELTRQQLWSALQREGVGEVPHSGPFDSAWHEAVARAETKDVPDGEVFDVLRKGYAWNGTVLRPAQVRVAAAPSKAGSKT